MRNVWIILTLGLTVFLSGETVSFWELKRYICAGEKRPGCGAVAAALLCLFEKTLRAFADLHVPFFSAVK